MDDIVKKALDKWPHVPACRGWLGLDARGHWYLRDDATQAGGPFPSSRGSRLAHDKLIDFIGRNYEADPTGQWYFQNGPQRVYVELEVTPWVWRIQPDLTVVSHTGIPATPRQCLVDELGRVYLLTDLGIGLVHSNDTTLVAQAIETGQWTPSEIIAADLSERFGYVMSPAASHVAQTQR
ncbi:DUF2946 family protein [Acidovorax sp.]|jgi:hypothetical protein|uniref:DUF2946 family protein n=1 Tax=Acidovorax sp. TaxID=1872122 RepID=UPI00391F71D1